MLVTAIALFSLAALLGMLLLTFVLRGKETPKSVAFTHGPLAAAGLVLLIVYACMHEPRPIESIVLFVIAATGGVILILRDLSGKTVPKWLAIIHGLIAVAGFAFLLVFTFSRP